MDRYQRGNDRLTHFLEHPLLNKIRNLIGPGLASKQNRGHTGTRHIPILKFFSRWWTGVSSKVDGLKGSKRTIAPNWTVIGIKVDHPRLYYAANQFRRFVLFTFWFGDRPHQSFWPSSFRTVHFGPEPWTDLRYCKCIFCHNFLRRIRNHLWYICH